jgi:hypothetical protein
MRWVGLVHGQAIGLEKVGNALHTLSRVAQRSSDLCHGGGVNPYRIKNHPPSQRLSGRASKRFAHLREEHA